MIYSDGIHIISDLSLDELHDYCQSIGIKRCWFHNGRHPHYDIPKRMRQNFFDITRMTKSSSKDLVRILKSK